MIGGAREQPKVRFDGVTKRFGAVTAVDRLNLDVAAGEFFALLGPSGCGKSTLLRLLAGFETPDDGRLLLDGEDITTRAPYQRPINMMFQNYALFPHLTVRGNIAFGLKQEGMARADIDRRVAEMLALVQLEGMGARKTHQLSGGQRQRVALARSLAKRPRVLLLDEPLAALDKKLRSETQLELMRLQRRLGTTFVIVTHDQEEAMTVADRIAVMNRGRIEQVARPPELYERPNSRWVAQFIGDVNLIDGRVVTAARGIAEIEDARGLRCRVATTAAISPGAAVSVAIRPEKLRLAAAPSDMAVSADDNRLAGEVMDIAYRGEVSVYKVEVGPNVVLTAALANTGAGDEPAIALRQKVWLTWPVRAGVLLDR